MNIITDLMRMLTRKEVVKNVEDDDLILLGKRKGAPVTGVSSPLPDLTTRLISAKNFFGAINHHGWARYDGDQYTTSAPLTIVDGAAAVVLPNNGADVVETYIGNSESFYDPTTQKIKMYNEGEVYQMVVTFKARVSNNSGTYVHLTLSSTGATPYDRVSKTVAFAKSNEWENVYEVFYFYADADFIANGNQWKIDASGNDVEIADVIFFIQKTFEPA